MKSTVTFNRDLHRVATVIQDRDRTVTIKVRSELEDIRDALVTFGLNGEFTV